MPSHEPASFFPEELEGLQLILISPVSAPSCQPSGTILSSEVGAVPAVGIWGSGLSSSSVLARKAVWLPELPGLQLSVGEQPLVWGHRRLCVASFLILGLGPQDRTPGVQPGPCAIPARLDQCTVAPKASALTVVQIQASASGPPLLQLPRLGP